MSSLARDLGASTASIYWYFRGRDDVLVGVVERVTRDIYDRLPSFVEEDWAAGAFQFFSVLRVEMARRPMILELTSERPGYFFSQPDVVAASSQHRRAWVALLTRLGVDADQAARMFRACLGYTHGVVLREFGAHQKPPRTP
jgi:AcrR family transcriptional regulator